MADVCRLCAGEVETFIDFGRMPIANGFLTEEEFSGEWFFNLRAGFCHQCQMVQLTELVDPARMFHDRYAFFSSTSSAMAEHFRRFAASVRERVGAAHDPLVVEIGSNDGILLRHFAEAGWRHVGVEPSGNVAAVARDRGIETVCAFFDAQLAARIVEERGKADAILGANVMCHIPDLHSVLEGVRLLLKPGGFLQFEDPYLGDIIEKTAYDQIYDEHAYYFSASSVARLARSHGLELVDVERQPVHGGSMRYTLCRAGEHPKSARADMLVHEEEQLGLHRPETFVRFRRSVEQSRDRLMQMLDEMAARGDRVVGYGATSKSTTVTNYCGIGPHHIEFISDTTPIKQGKFSPGAHIPVRPYEEFRARYPDYGLLFAWNHAREIMTKERDFRASGGRWIVYVPRTEVLS